MIYTYHLLKNVNIQYGDYRNAKRPIVILNGGISGYL